jgi:hypothetical protein
MDIHHEQVAGPRALTFGFFGGLASWALIVLAVFGLTRVA